jgi:hypothetical protein
MEWGDLALAAQAAGSLTPAWKKFIKTKFFVPIERSQDDDPKNFLLHLRRNAEDGKATLIISEVRARLDPRQGDGLVALSGGEIVRRLEDQGGIEIALRDGVFSISKKRVDWLRSGIKVTKARVVTRKILLDAAPAAPLPVLKIAAESGPQSALAAEDMDLDLPLAEPVSMTRYAIPAVLSLVVIGVVAAIFVPFGAAPESAAVPPPFEAPLPVRSAASPALPVAPPTERMMPFAPFDNSFTVTLPGMAEEVELSPDQVNQMGETLPHHYRLRFEDRMYTLEATEYLGRAPQDLTSEMDVRQASVVGRDGTLIRATPVGLRGATGREVRVRLPNGGERAARFAFIGNKFCMVMVTVANGNFSAPQIDAFLNSFQLN